MWLLPRCFFAGLSPNISRADLEFILVEMLAGVLAPLLSVTNFRFPGVVCEVWLDFGKLIIMFSNFRKYSSPDCTLDDFLLFAEFLGETGLSFVEVRLNFPPDELFTRYLA